MVNWKVYTITGTPTSMVNNRRGSFNLDDYVNYKGGNWNYIWCISTYPYNTFKVGDKIEIDNDKTKQYWSLHDFNDFSIVRRFSTETLSSSSSTDMVIGSTTITRENYLAVARGLDRMVEQSGGMNEYTAHIEVRDNQNNTIKFSLSSKRVNY